MRAHVGKPYTTMTYQFSGTHEGIVFLASNGELLLPLQLHGTVGSAGFGNRSCSRTSVVANLYLSCSTVSSAACPVAQGPWYADADPTTFVQTWHNSSGPAFANCHAGGGGGGGGGGHCKSGTQWSTSIIDLTTGRRLRLGPRDLADKRDAPLLTTEIRVDQNGDKEFILDQWALVRPGNEVERSSASQASADWLAAVPSVPRDRPLLVIQKPIHAVPMPEPLIRFDRAAANEYMRSVRPSPRPATITARLEFAPNGALLSKEVLRGDAQIGARLADLVSVESLHGHSHRAVVFPTFEVTRRRARLVGAETALTKCCCGSPGFFCN